MQLVVISFAVVTRFRIVPFNEIQIVRNPYLTPPHIVFLLYLLNSLFLGAEILRLFLKFYGESFGIQFELVRFRWSPR